MNADDLRTLWRFNAMCIEKNLEGVTPEECLVQPDPDGNSMNWILGHVVATRHTTLQLLGIDGPWSAEQVSKYKRGSRPLAAGEGALPLDELRAAEIRTRELLGQGLDAVTQVLLDSDAEEGSACPTVGGDLMILEWHEGYHIGQLGLLRRILGREGAIP